MAVQRTLTTAEADFHDLADCVIVGAKPSAERDTSPRHRWRAPTPDPGTMLLALLDQQALNRWEASFVQSVYGQYRQGRILSDKQLNIICQIWIKTEHAT